MWAFVRRIFGWLCHISKPPLCFVRKNPGRELTNSQSDGRANVSGPQRFFWNGLPWPSLFISVPTSPMSLTNKNTSSRPK